LVFEMCCSHLIRVLLIFFKWPLSLRPPLPPSLTPDRPLLGFRTRAYLTHTPHKPHPHPAQTNNTAHTNPTHTHPHTHTHTSVCMGMHTDQSQHWISYRYKIIRHSHLPHPYCLGESQRSAQ